MEYSRTILEKNILAFTEKLNVGILLPYLEASDQLSDNEMFRLQNVSPVESRDILFDIIRRKCPNSFVPFYEGLVKTGQMELANLLSAKHVPYLSKLEGGGLQPGQTVVIKGLQTADTFNVFFMTGPGHESADIAFSFVVHQKEKHAILNDRKAGKWGKEEKKKEPFKEGEPVDLRFRCHDNKFDVFANLKEIATFEYRQPLNAVNHLYIDGGIDLQDVNWGGKYYDESTVCLLKKTTYTVCGVPENAFGEFHISLITDEGEKAFRFSAMFPRMVVLNSCFGGCGRREVIEGEFPFERKKAFNVAIVSEPSAFQVFVNGSHFCAFAHRIDPNVIKGLKIEGDVILMGVHVK